MEEKITGPDDCPIATSTLFCTLCKTHPCIHEEKGFQFTSCPLHDIVEDILDKINDSKKEKIKSINTDIQEDKKRIILTPEILYKNFKSTCVGDYNGYFFKIRESDNLYVYGNYSGEPYHFYVARIKQIYNPRGMTSEHFTYYDCYFDDKHEVKYIDELQSILEEYGINKEIVL